MRPLPELLDRLAILDLVSSSTAINLCNLRSDIDDACDWSRDGDAHHEYDDHHESDRAQLGCPFTDILRHDHATDQTHPKAA